MNSTYMYIRSGCSHYDVSADLKPRMQRFGCFNWCHLGRIYNQPWHFSATEMVMINFHELKTLCEQPFVNDLSITRYPARSTLFFFYGLPSSKWEWLINWTWLQLHWERLYWGNKSSEIQGTFLSQFNQTKCSLERIHIVSSSWSQRLLPDFSSAGGVAGDDVSFY